MHQRLFLLFGLAAVPTIGSAAGTLAGTDIVSQVAVDYEIGAEAYSGLSNVVTVTVAEVIDINVLIQTPERLVSSGVTAQALNYTLSNTGNGTEAMLLTPVMALTGDSFDPLPAPVSIIIDADSDGMPGVGDTNYVPGVNDPVLGPDESIGLFLIADIPGGLGDGLIGFAALQAQSTTASGVPGQVFAAIGDAGVDVVLGPSGGIASAQGEYLVGEISLSLTKLASVSSPDGDTRPVPGAQLTYTIQVAAVGTGSATQALFRDPIPEYTSFVPGSLRLNGTALSDAEDADSGEYIAATPEVVVRLGSLQPSDAAQVIEFTVSIN